MVQRYKYRERKDSIKLVSVDSIFSNENIIIVNAVLPIEFGHCIHVCRKAPSIDLCQNYLSELVEEFVLHENHRCLNCESELAWYVVFIEIILSTSISCFGRVDMEVR